MPLLGPPQPPPPPGSAEAEKLAAELAGKAGELATGAPRPPPPPQQPLDGAGLFGYGYRDPATGRIVPRGTPGAVGDPRINPRGGILPPQGPPLAPGNPGPPPGLVIDVLGLVGTALRGAGAIALGIAAIRDVRRLANGEGLSPGLVGRLAQQNQQTPAAAAALGALPFAAAAAALADRRPPGAEIEADFAAISRLGGPMDCKLILHFSQPNYKNVPGGWSEDYYFSAAGLPAAQTFGAGLALARSRLLVAPATILDYRVSDEANPGAAAIFRNFTQENYAYQPYGITVASGPVELSWQAQYCRLYSADFSVARPLMLRGIPDAVTSPWEGADLAINADWQAKLTAYLAGLATTGVKIRCLKKPPTLSVPITAVQFGAGLANFQVADSTPFTVGRQYHFYNLRAWPGLSGPATVTSKGTGFIAIPWTGAQGPPPRRLTARVSSIDYVYVGVGSGQAETITHRVTGKPSGSQRGRRRAAAR